MLFPLTNIHEYRRDVVASYVTDLHLFQWTQSFILVLNEGVQVQYDNIITCPALAEVRLHSRTYCIAQA
jgi:hypothetical protein